MLAYHTVPISLYFHLPQLSVRISAGLKLRQSEIAADAALSFLPTVSPGSVAIARSSISTPQVAFASWLLLKHAFTEAFENHASQNSTDTEPIRPLHFKGECVLDNGLRPVDNTPAALDTCLRRLGLFLAGVDTGLAYRFSYHSSNAAHDHKVAYFRCCQDVLAADYRISHSQSPSEAPSANSKKRRSGRRAMDRFECASLLVVTLFPRENRVTVEAKHAMPHVVYSRVDVPEEAEGIIQQEADAGTKDEFVHTATRLRLPPFWSSSDLELADGIVFPDVGVQPDQPAPASLPLNVAVPLRAAREDINGDDPETDCEADANAEETDERYQLLLTKMDECRSILVAQAEHNDHRHVMEWEKVLGRSLDRVINSAKQEEIAKRRGVQQDPTQRQHRHQGSMLFKYYR
ncbi:hypothetical protein D1P53_004581 [Cryptococcus gattii VGV]|nr:hypothetical protein D1P53_004581 [Cryptococcus gattii VGV]